MTLHKSLPLPSLVPSLPAHSFEELRALCDALEGAAAGFQIDIVDGRFAPYVSWPFMSADVPLELQKLSELMSRFEIEMDCMCMHPEQYLDLFAVLKVARVVIHAGSTEHYENCIKNAHAHGYRIGLGILNTTSPAFCDEHIPLFDFVQVMGIEHIGVQGQPFDERTIGTLESLRAAYPDLEIAVDGAVNEETIPRLLAAGATRFAPGSAISQAPNPKEAFKALRTLAVRDL